MDTACDREFAEVHDKILRAYRIGRYNEALRVLAGLSPALLEQLSPDYKFYYYEAVSLSAYMVHNVRLSVEASENAVVQPVSEGLQGRLISLYSNYLMYLHYLPDVGADKMYRAHVHYGELFAKNRQFQHNYKDCCLGKLRVGYISSDLFDHVVVNFAVQLWAGYDRNRFEVHLYSLGGTHNETSDWLKQMVDGWHDLEGMTEAEAADIIYRDDIDILVDLSGHTNGGNGLKVMAYRPSPVQISGLGYFDTTGLASVDYLLTDNFLDPEGVNDKYFTEKLLRLPRSHFCWTPPKRVLDCRRKWQIHEPIVFGCFNSFEKITDEMLFCWKEILERVPGSRLLLKGRQEYNGWWEVMAERLKVAGFKQGQVELRARSMYYLDEYADMDIALDTYPYPGGGTTCETLYMGVPVITCYGSRHGSRFGYSLLANLGLDELAAPDMAGYVERAVALADSPELLNALHARLREMMRQSPLMDAKGYVREVEEAYIRAWEEKQASLKKA